MRITDMLKGMMGDNTVRNTPVDSQRMPASERIQKEIASLVPGKTVQGEVVDRNGNDVLIRLNNDLEISAKLDQDVYLEIGKLINFEVKNNGKTLSLSPLLTNTANSDTVMKALNMAGLPVNDKTLAMAEKMLNQGMSVDSKTLQSVFKDALAFPNAEIEDIVNLHKLHMPVNQANLDQMESYRNLTHELVSGMSDVLEELPGVAKDVYAKEGADGLIGLYRELISENGLNDAGMMPELLEDEDQNFLEHALKGLLEKAGGKGEEAVGGAVEEAANPVADKAALSEQEALSAQDGKPQKLYDAANALLQKAKEGVATKEDLLNLVANRFEIPEEAKEMLSQIVRHPSFEKTVKEAFLKQWTVEPETLHKEGEVEKVYERMDRQLKSLQNVLSEHGVASEMPAAKAVTNLSQNIDFLNQLNQMYTYVQLPLKMVGGEKNGELYVFTNKRSLASKDGAVSAMLHLDMDHLGPVDVYVTMQEQKVGTRFMVKDDEMLDFLNDHMDVLTSRLAKRGYSVNCEMKLLGDKEDPGPVETLIESDKGKALSSMNGFDVRA